jgi:hypothetical protein
MKIESSLKHFHPQSMHISDAAKGTSPDRLTGTDIMAALGVTCSRARVGLSMFMGKAGSHTDEQRAIQALARHALDHAPKNVRKAAGGQLGQCALILARFAFSEYSRSAATSSECPDCRGAGVIRTEGEIVKYAGYIGMDGEEKISPVTEQGVIEKICVTCHGRGVISARCRCGGSGQVLDREATKARGAPVIKACERCSGKGFKSTPSTAAYKAILTVVSDLHVRTWTRNWKPFYEALVDSCHKAEHKADVEFQQVTSFSDDASKI